VGLYLRWIHARSNATVRSMRRILVVLAFVQIAVCGLSTAANAAGPAVCGENRLGNAIECEGESEGTDSVTLANTSGRSSGTSSEGSKTKYVPYNRLSTGPDGQPCATTGYVEEGVAPADERLLVDPNPRESNIPVTGNDLSILETYPPCPQRPRAPGEPEPVETRAMVAARYWEQVPLPKPVPGIAPGRAITGRLAYLETRGRTSHTYTNATVFGPLEIVATGSYTVNWGDGTTTGPHSFEGRPWPEGRITHEYLHVGTYDVVVTERWTATWSLDGERGVLRALQTTGTIDDFPVQQIQAVIVG
jgi:hypothetical protein